jgi:2,2-dialkylglycine decarboxylase (pyruvate)
MDSTGPSLPADQFVLHSLRRDPCVRFVRGENARLWDADGLSYLDTMSGSAGPAMVGHANPHVAEAVARQMATLPTTNILHQSDAVIAYCTRLAGLTPQGLTKIALVAGGGEAIEAAIKLAMRVTGRTEVLSLHGAYHGMSLATMGLAGIAPDRSWLPGALRWPTFRQVPNADAYRNPLGEGPDAWRASLGALENAMDGGYRQVAAFVMEVVQGPGGHVLFPPGYYQAVQRACHARGVLLIVDEIQTGLGRCGANWACDLFGLRPDILVAGKALGGGVPVGALAVRADLVDAEIESEPWNILTFMNQPLAAAAGMAVLDVVEGERLIERARTLGAHPGEGIRTDARPGRGGHGVHRGSGPPAGRHTRLTYGRGGSWDRAGGWLAGGQSSPAPATGSGGPRRSSWRRRAPASAASTWTKRRPPTRSRRSRTPPGSGSR